jgi:hypothetical protein
LPQNGRIDVSRLRAFAVPRTFSGLLSVARCLFRLLAIARTAFNFFTIPRTTFGRRVAVAWTRFGGPFSVTRPGFASLSVARAEVRSWIAVARCRSESLSVARCSITRHKTGTRARITVAADGRTVAAELACSQFRDFAAQMGDFLAELADHGNQVPVTVARRPTKRLVPSRRARLVSLGGAAGLVRFSGAPRLVAFRRAPRLIRFGRAPPVRVAFWRTTSSLSFG